MMVGDNTSDSGGDSLFLHQSYPLLGLKDSHGDKLFGGSMQLKVKLILKNITPGDTIKEFVSHNELCKILTKVRGNFVKMRNELKQASINRDKKLRELRILKTNRDIIRRNKARESDEGLSKDDEEMYGREKELEIMSYIELGRRPEETKVEDELLEVRKKLEDAKRVGHLLEEELKDKLLILKEYMDGTFLKKFLHDLQARFGESILDLVKSIGDTSEFIAQKAQSAVYSREEWDRTLNVEADENTGIVPWVSSLLPTGDSNVIDGSGKTL